MKPYYEDDFVTIYHGDCQGLELEGDFMVTDPPYGIGWKRSENKARASAAHPGIQGDESTDLRDAILVEWDFKPAVVFGSLAADRPPNTVQTLIWHKPADSGVVGAVYGFRRDVEAIFLTGCMPKRNVQWSSVLRGGRGERLGHPHAKPLGLLRQLIGLAPGVILDPFMGSGSTLRAAKDLGRKAIGIEIEERYCEIAAQRMGQEVLDLGMAA